MTTEGYMQIEHRISEAIMLRDFTKRQRKVLDLILRLSWGIMQKRHANIPRQRDFEVIGISEGHIGRELQWLRETRVIIVNGEEYSFNENIEEWNVSTVKPYMPEKLTELVSINLKTYRNGKSENEELTKTVSKNLPKREVSIYQNGKFATPELVSPKESIKESDRKTTTTAV